MYNSKQQNVNIALTYIINKWYVYPVWGINPQTLKCYCGSAECRAGKHPYGRAVPHGSNDASIDPALIAKWFAGEGVNVGIDCSQSNLLVIDFDLKHGGMDTHAKWEAEHGAMPLTPCVSSGGGGRHYYFRKHPLITSNATTLKHVGIDVLTSGGLIAPPSLHESGKRYEWLTPCNTPLADCPDWLVSLIVKPQEQDEEPQDVNIDPMRGTFAKSGTTFDTLNDCPAGRRNAVVLSTIGSMLANGYTPEQILEQGTEWAERQSPPYSLADLRERVKSIAKREESKAKDVLLGGGVRVVEQNDALDAGAIITPYEETNLRIDEQPMEAEFVNSSIRNDPQHTPAPVMQSDDPTLIGLIGDTIRRLTPQTEIDEAGILFALLTAFGSVVGHKAYCNIGARRHYVNLFVVLHAPTGVGKGEAWHIVKGLFGNQEDWLANCLGSSFGSGEGLVDRLRDEETISEGGKEIILQGVDDKRLLSVDAEFRNTLILCRRPDSTLSGQILKAWDGDALQVLNRKKNALRSTDHHISIIGNITTRELSEALNKGSEAFNGWGNRFLWIAVKRSKIINFLKPIDYGDLRERWAKAIAIAQQIEQITYDKSFERDYEAIVNSLVADASDETLKANVLERSRPYVFRLAMIYALADGVAVMTGEHCKAAYACWRINVNSCKAVFGNAAGSQPTTSLTERLLTMICQSGTHGMTKTEMHHAFNRNKTKDDIAFAVEQLEQNRLIYSRRVKGVVRWFASSLDRPTGDGVQLGEDDEDEDDARINESGELTGCELIVDTNYELTNSRTDEGANDPPTNERINEFTNSTKDAGQEFVNSLIRKGDEADEPQAAEGEASEVVINTPTPVTQISETAVRGSL